MCSYAFCKYVHIAQTLLYTIALHISLYICLQTVLLLLLMYVQMHVLTLRCSFCKSRKTALVKLVKRFNAKQMQKCSFDCLLLASFSVVISLSYFVQSISLVGKACKFPNRLVQPVSNFLPNKLCRVGIPT